MVSLFAPVRPRFRLELLAVAVVCLLPAVGRPQKIDKGKLDTADRRARDATKVLTDVSALPPGENIPRDLIDRARAIAVFPETSSVNMLVQKFMKGNGVMSRRGPGGWSTPAFYSFAVIDTGWTKVKGDRPGIIMLFMDDGILEGFETDHVPLVGAAGPVGELTPEKEKEIQGAGIVIYAFSASQLRGINVPDDSSTQSGISADNHLNEAIYGMKGRDIFSGKSPAEASIPPAVTEFQNKLLSLSK